MTPDTNRSSDIVSEVSTNVQARVVQVVAASLGRDSVALDAGLVTDFKITSYEFLKLIEQCEEEFEIDIPDDETLFLRDMVETVSELAEVLDHKLYPQSRIPAILRKRQRRGPGFGKNIIICCDGTGNEYGKNNTNVVSGYRALTRDEDQIAFYDPGIGTFDALGRTVGKKVGTILGQGFGWGLSENIQDAYIYLMDRYEPGDRIYMFGFSRGAFTVRSLAGLLHKCGLLQKGSNNLVPYAMKIYNQRGNDKLAAGFKDTYCHECKPHLIGVWDTVGSLGHVLSRKFFDAKLNHDVRFGYHAVAIDEKRKKFPVSLWDESNVHPDQHIEQVWFAGVHSDVGGWYDERGLSDAALKWMLKKAEAAGLRLRDGWEKIIELNPNPADEKAQHESRTGVWRLWPKALRSIPENALVHRSVIERMKAINRYKPALPATYKEVCEDEV